MLVCILHAKLDVSSVGQLPSCFTLQFPFFGMVISPSGPQKQHPPLKELVEQQGAEHGSKLEAQRARNGDVGVSTVMGVPNSWMV